MANKLLVICVDRDNDVGEKAGIVTPVVGRDACIEAAQRLALEDPENADSNSIFYAIKTYEDLTSKGYQTEIITVAGTEDRGVQADEKIVREIKQVLEKFSANGAVIVSDGEDDESVIPVIQNVLPIISVQRVVMKVSRSVEYSYAVFGKYLKMITGIILILASIPAGIALVEQQIVNTNMQLFDVITNKIIVGQFISGVLPILWIGFGSIFGGILLSNWLGGSLKKISDVLRLIVLGAIYPTVAQFTNILIHDESPFTLIPMLLVGLVITLISATLLF